MKKIIHNSILVSVIPFLFFLSLKKNVKLDRIFILILIAEFFSSRLFSFKGLLQDYSKRKLNISKISNNFIKIQKGNYWKDFNINISLDTNIKNFDKIISPDISEIFYDKIYDKYTLKDKSYENIIDCGGNIGLFSLNIAKNFNVKKIHIFEASSRIYQILNKNIKLNKLDSVLQPNQNYLDCDNKKVNFVFDDECFTMSKISEDNKGELVNTTTLDDYVFNNSLKVVDLIKMDIEGSEINALKGAIKTIKKFKPNLIISAYHSPYQLVEILAFLLKLNMNYYISVPRNNLAHPIVYANIKQL